MDQIKDKECYGNRRDLIRKTELLSSEESETVKSALFLDDLQTTADKRRRAVRTTFNFCKLLEIWLLYICRQCRQVIYINYIHICAIYYKSII